MLSTQVKKHYAVLEDNRQIPITREQANQLYKLKSDKDIPQNRFVTLPGFVGELRKVKEITAIPTRPQGNGYYCDFGVFHPQHESCNCAKTFRCPSNLFQSELFAKFPKINYNREITAEMREIILKQLGKI